MELSVILFGKGGYGVHTLGRVMRAALLKENPSLYIALAVDYDTVVKGGVSNCHLIISDEPCNPVVEGKPDVAVDYVASRAILRTRDGVLYLGIPAEANRRLSESVRGYVLLGMLVAREYLPLSKEAVHAAIEAECKTPRMCLANQNAFGKGFEL